MSIVSHTLAHLRLVPRSVQALREGDCMLEGSVGLFSDAIVLSLLILREFLLSADRQNPADNADINILLVHAGMIGRRLDHRIGFRHFPAGRKANVGERGGPVAETVEPAEDTVDLVLEQIKRRHATRMLAQARAML